MKFGIIGWALFRTESKEGATPTEPTPHPPFIMMLVVVMRNKTNVRRTRKYSIKVKLSI